MRAIATLGALVELRKAGWLDGARTFAGTSVGAVLPTLLAINADLESLVQSHAVAGVFRGDGGRHRRQG